MRTGFRKSFLRDLKKVKDQEVLDRVAEVIERVEAAATPGEAGDLKKLSGSDDAYRIRIGEYRVGVVIEGEVLEFVRFLPRKDLYRFFP
jgi:mRNA interferase RelE/StbE